MEMSSSTPKRLRKTRLAEVIPLILGCVGSPYALAQLTPPPPPISTYAGDPGLPGNAASWRTAEFQRDVGMASVSAEYAYAAGFAGQGVNVGLVDSGVFQGHWLEHSAYPPSGVANGPTRYYAVDATGGTTGFTSGFYNQSYNDTHGTHVSGTVGATRDGSTAATNMHGVAFDADVYMGNTHKTDGVLYGLRPANATAAQTLDNAYLGNVYRAFITKPTANGVPLRYVHSSWGSQPSTENYNTYDPPPGGPASFGVKNSFLYLNLPEGVPDANGNTSHWLNGALDAVKAGLLIQFSAGNGGYNNPTPRGCAPYFLPYLEGSWYTVSGLTTTGRTFNADGSVLVPGTNTFNRCGIAKWSCVSAPSNSINSTTVTVTGGVPTATYGSASGTSMAGPHSAALLGLVMNRFPYMSNSQALYTMMTTARQNATTNDAAGNLVSPNPTQGQMVSVPDSRNGWGTPNMKDAFKGPGQFIGRLNIDTHGYNDVWSNNITNVAMDYRKTEDDAEGAAWDAQVIAKGWQNGPPAGSSQNDVNDYNIGITRAQARATRIYAGGLSKAGTGNLYLMGNLNVPGATQVSGGKLGILGTHSSAASVSGGTLVGTGNIQGALSVLGGTLSPGVGPDDAASIQNFTLPTGNVLNASTVKMGPAASYVATIRSASDFTQLRTTGAAAVGGNLLVSLSGSLPAGTVITIIHSDTSILGTFKNLPQGATFTVGAQQFAISYTGGNVTLTAQGGAPT